MNLNEFDFELPESLIAQTPLEKRDHSRLMVLNAKSKKIENKYFLDLPDLLDSNTVIVCNNSRVIPARLITPLGYEVFIVKQISSDKTQTTCECMVKPGKKFKVGTTIEFTKDFFGTVINILSSGLRVINFQHKDSFMNALELCGQTPLPPYIKESVKDPERYQTIYNQHAGSVAAPTAGLHFTTKILKQLEEKGIPTLYTTLHVGLGTFQPVKSDNIKDHNMHSEVFELSEGTANKLNQYKKEGRKILAVGTTAVRVLETCADEKGILHPQKGETSIFIYPGYTFKFVNQLITNFHLPKSTLIMLVSALAGKEFVLKAYQEAVIEKYRFYSFGDAMYIKT